MSKITLDNLSDNLKEYLEGLGLTEEQVRGVVVNIIGNLDDLNTNDKTNVIRAINELNSHIDENTNNITSMEENITEIEGEINTIQNNIGVLDNLTTTNKSNLVEAINELFQSGNNAKQELVAALVAKGLGATTDMSFNELMGMLNGLTLGVIPTGTAVASDVLSGKTFINSTGQTLTGNIVSRGSKTITPGTSNQTLDAGYYSGVTISGDSDLKSANIIYGKTIFGVSGPSVSSEISSIVSDFLNSTSSSYGW